MKLTHVMNKANVNCNMLKECLDFLTKQVLPIVEETGNEARNQGPNLYIENIFAEPSILYLYWAWFAIDF